MKIKSLPALVALLSSPLALLASPADDRKIESAAHASYNYQHVLDDRVKAKADNGVVTLTGSVHDQGEKRLAVDTVEALPGVTAVKNELTIKAEHAERSDGWMALKIRSRLLVKANVSATATEVDVKDGVVTLSGKADNAAQKELTAAYAKDIDGVKSVTNNMVVAAPATENRDAAREPVVAAGKKGAGHRSMSDKVDDASITAQVKYALLTHKSTSALSTKISTKDGVVQVDGIAGSDAEKSLVTKLAQDVRGAVSVKNDMTVAKAAATAVKS